MVASCRTVLSDLYRTLNPFENLAETSASFNKLKPINTITCMWSPLDNGTEEHMEYVMEKFSNLRLQ